MLKDTFHKFTEREKTVLKNIIFKKLRYIGKNIDDESKKDLKINYEIENQALKSILLKIDGDLTRSLKNPYRQVLRKNTSNDWPLHKNVYSNVAPVKQSVT